jgi:hypothetical protein
VKPWEMNWSSTPNAPDNSSDASNPAVPDPELLQSLVTQESGGDWNAVGPTYNHKDGRAARRELGEIALGKYQVVPKYWFDKIGLDPTSLQDQETYLSSPWIQKKAVQFVLQDAAQRYPGDRRKQAAAYYGGAGAADLLDTPGGDTPQSGGYAVH